MFVITGLVAILVVDGNNTDAMLNRFAQVFVMAGGSVSGAFFGVTLLSYFKKVDPNEDFPPHETGHGGAFPSFMKSQKDSSK
ncbi:MAG: hypothetical protein R3C11_17275 [Planctomycetaceae bacterium]